MINAALLTPNDRRDLFLAASDQAHKHPVIIEKDFWVSWLLNLLFADAELKEHLIFKGGTSLSKSYDLIERFSEDIDLIIRYERLGFVDDKDPRADRSRTKQRQINHAAIDACRSYIKNEFCRQVTELVQAHIDDASGAWSVHTDPNEPDALLFQYPPGATTGLSYIAPQVKLELGPHAAIIPQQPTSVVPYLKQALPDHVTFPTTPVATIAAERTFWEKVTILHAEAHRTSPTPNRYSRHYYDTVMMARHAELLKRCIGDPDLLTAVREHKTKFYYTKWARFDLAVPGTLRLLPHDDERLKLIAQDYRAMQPMFTDKPPSFSEVIEELGELERSLNNAPDSNKS
jgi:hypothetical protein